MLEESSIPIYIPQKFVEEVLLVIETGLKETRLPPEIKRQLKHWFEVEKALVEEKLDEVDGLHKCSGNGVAF